MITQQQLQRAVDNPIDKKRLDAFVASFNQWAESFGITSKQRVVHYLAQVFRETGELKYCEEIASGQQYEGRKDLGNTHNGDGRRYKGRGYLQLTGRANYTLFNAFDLCTEDVVKSPEKVAEFPLNQIASMWFWQNNKLNELADQDDGGLIGSDIVRRITRKVNGGTNGLAQRLFYYRRFKKEFGL